MKSSNDGASTDDLFTTATLNVSRDGDFVVAVGQVVAKRLALGIAAAWNPLAADHDEFARILPEKVEAFSAAGAIMLEQSDQASRHLTRIASDEVMTTANATVSMASCYSPAELAMAQGSFALAWFDRAAVTFLAMGMLALRAQDAAMEPIRQTVAANAERLGW